MSDKIKAIHGDVEAADFVQRHSCVIAPLAVVSNGTRRVTGSGADGLLSEDEKTELKGACAAFGVAWKAAYDRPLTQVEVEDVSLKYFGDRQTAFKEASYDKLLLSFLHKALSR